MLIQLASCVVLGANSRIIADPAGGDHVTFDSTGAFPNCFELF
jgi:hypothetical protein